MLCRSGENARITQRLEHFAEEYIRQTHLSSGTIVEAQKQPVVWQCLNFGGVQNHIGHSRGLIGFNGLS